MTAASRIHPIPRAARRPSALQVLLQKEFDAVKAAGNHDRIAARMKISVMK